MVHIGVTRNNRRQQGSPPNNYPQTSKYVQNAHGGADNEATQTVLPTASVTVLDYDCEPVVLRALLDSGSQVCFLSEVGFKRLRCRRLQCDNIVTILGGEETHQINGPAKIQLRAPAFEVTVSVLIIPTITGIFPICAIDVTELSLPETLGLADEKFDVPARVDLLLGADVFHELILPSIAIQRNGLTLIHTVFGWAVSGPISSPAKLKESAETDATVTDET